MPLLTYKSPLRKTGRCPKKRRPHALRPVSREPHADGLAWVVVLLSTRPVGPLLSCQQVTGAVSCCARGVGVRLPQGPDPGSSLSTPIAHRGPGRFCAPPPSSTVGREAEPLPPTGSQLRGSSGGGGVSPIPSSGVSPLSMGGGREAGTWEGSGSDQRLLMATVSWRSPWTPPSCGGSGSVRQAQGGSRVTEWVKLCDGRICNRTRLGRALCQILAYGVQVFSFFFWSF